MEQRHTYEEPQAHPLQKQEFPDQPVDVTTLTDAFGIGEETILQFIDELEGKEPITNGDAVTLIRRRQAEMLISRHGATTIAEQLDPGADARWVLASSDLRRFFSGEVLGLLAEMILNGEAISFLVGGCRIAAHGLYLWMTASRAQLHAWDVAVDDDLPDAIVPRLVVVADRWYHPKHVVVKVEEVFVDASGIQTAAELLARYGAHYKDPRLVNYNAARLTRYQIRADDAMSSALARRIARAFGPFRREWLFRKSESAC